MILEGGGVMIMTGKLTSFYGKVITIYDYQNKKQRALVATFDENNIRVYRRYNSENLIRWDGCS